MFVKKIFFEGEKSNRPTLKNFVYISTFMNNYNKYFISIQMF
jgi:hypothetical protein